MLKNGISEEVGCLFSAFKAEGYQGVVELGQNDVS